MISIARSHVMGEIINQYFPHSSNAEEAHNLGLNDFRKVDTAESECEIVPTMTTNGEAATKLANITLPAMTQ